MTDNVDVCTSEIELVGTIKNTVISRLQKLIRNWKIIIFVDILLIILNVGTIYYKIIFSQYIVYIVWVTLIIQFLILLTGIIFIFLLKREVRTLKKCGLGNVSRIEIEKPEFRSKIRLCPNRGPIKGKCKGGR